MKALGLRKQCIAFADEFEGGGEKEGEEKESQGEGGITVLRSFCFQTLSYKLSEI